MVNPLIGKVLGRVENFLSVNLNPGRFMMWAALGCVIYFHPRIKASALKAAHADLAAKRQMAEERRLAEELSKSSG
ncbi:hypothetical protein Tsubulata_050730 [Turnera subulata]|uniref:Uncharacterized protein n=1 Tax=Turnera subulata TaxID=218843 RepID=A0A9Q0GF71_9ROSI|nr:hypothetical protein Tsubulata_050730 [Turnera subulata]